MRFSNQKVRLSADLELHQQPWDVCFAGNPLDDRGRAAIQFAKEHSQDVIEVEYRHHTFEFRVGETWMSVDEVEGWYAIFAGKSILIEATSVGFAEILLMMKALRRGGATSISFVYVEPGDYRKSVSPEREAMREFELSKEVRGFAPIPGHSTVLSGDRKHEVVFFLGYEAARLERAFEEYDLIKPENCTIIFGVPAFKPGWEMDAFHNNVSAIKNRDIRRQPLFCGAENPIAAVRMLNEIREGVGEQVTMFVAPIGPKPQGVATAIFASVFDKTGILYDHPVNMTDRSQSTGNWHLLNVSELEDDALHA